MTAVRVEIKGLDEFRRDIHAADKKARRRIDKGLREAAWPMRDDARRRYYSVYTRRTGRSGRAIKISSHRGAVVYSMRAKRHLYMAGQEWGAVDPRYSQFFRGGRNPLGGTFYWPAYIRGQSRLNAALTEALEKTISDLAGAGVTRYG